MTNSDNVYEKIINIIRDNIALFQDECDPVDRMGRLKNGNIYILSEVFIEISRSFNLSKSECIRELENHISVSQVKENFEINPPRYYRMFGSTSYVVLHLRDQAQQWDGMIDEIKTIRWENYA